MGSLTLPLVRYLRVRIRKRTFSSRVVEAVADKQDMLGNKTMDEAEILESSDCSVCSYDAGGQSTDSSLSQFSGSSTSIQESQLAIDDSNSRPAPLPKHNSLRKLLPEQETRSVPHGHTHREVSQRLLETASPSNNIFHLRSHNAFDLACYLSRHSLNPTPSSSQQSGLALLHSRPSLFTIHPNKPSSLRPSLAAKMDTIRALFELFDRLYFFSALSRHTEIRFVNSLPGRIGGECRHFEDPLSAVIMMNMNKGRWEMEFHRKLILHEMVHAWFILFGCHVDGFVSLLGVTED